MRFLLLAVALFTAVPGAACGDDWPTDRHDNARSGVTSERIVPPLELQWTFQSPFPPAPGWSLPVNGYGARKNKPNVCYDDAFRVIAVGDSCYFCSSAENRLFAVDIRSGKVRWSFFTDAAPRLAPAYWDGKLYFGADDGLFRCVDAQTGELLWQIDASSEKEMMLGYGRFHAQRPIRAAGIVDGAVAYFAAGLFPNSGVELFAVDATDGSILWRRRLDRGGMGNVVPQGPILASADSLWLTSRIAPTRYSKAEGRPIDFATPFPRVPNAHEYRYYNGGTEAQLRGGGQIVYGAACMLAYDADALWKDKWGRSKRGSLSFAWFNARQILFDDRAAYVATDYYLAAVEQDQLHEVTRNECRRFEEAYKKLRVAAYLDLLDRHRRLRDELGSRHPTVRKLEEGPLKWGRSDWEKWNDMLPSLLDDLEAKCQWMTQQRATEAMILAGNVIYAGSDDRVLAFDATTGKELWSFVTGSRVRSLAAANGRVFASTVDGRIRCFGPHAAGSTPRLVHDRTNTPPLSDAPREPVQREIRRLLDTAAPDDGYCLILGSRNPALAEEIARQTKLRVEMLCANAPAVEQMRRALAARKLYGGRVVVHHWVGKRLPYPPYVFNLVIDEATLAGGQPLAELKELYRVTKPCGGWLLLGTSAEAGSVKGTLEGIVHRHDTILLGAHFARVIRGPIPGARDWTHNYATAANTYCSEDRLVRGPFAVLWYGEPGPQQRIDRHATPPVPLVVGSTMFTIGPKSVMAYDIYNGACLWQREIPGAAREHLPINTSNLAADRESIFVVADRGRCFRLDAQTGQTIHIYTLPDRRENDTNHWAWIAREGNLLFGSRAEPDPAGWKPSEQTSNQVFAVDIESGQTVWSYRGQGIDHDGIAVAAGKVFLVDRQLSDEEHQKAEANTIHDHSVPDRQRRDRRGNPIGPDLRKIVVLNAATGKTIWQKPWNLSDVTLDDRAVQGKAGIACMVARGVLVVHGTGSLGHPHREFLAGEFARRALYAFDASTGRYLWGGRKGYRKRPIIVGNRVYAEPFAWDLRTGKQVMVPNPLSGRLQPLDFHRGYIGCGHLMASACSLFGARDGVAYWNLDEQAGFTPFAGLALACGIGAAPAGGVFVVPEGRSGCTCATPIHTSITLYPKPNAEAWSVGFSGGRAEVVPLPVRCMSINLGAPGYRHDTQGNLWIPYPARVDAGPLGHWLPTYQHTEQMCYRINPPGALAQAELAWVYTWGYRDEKPLRFRLRGEGHKPARYTVKLYFAEPDDVAAGDRVFSVLLQGKPVAEKLDLVARTGSPRKPLVLTFPGVLVDRDLEIGLKRSPESSKPPVLCGIQAFCEAE